MVGPTANRILDKLHQATVGVLVVSTLYFGVEAFRATWYIQKHKAEQRVSVAACQRVGPGHERHQPGNHTSLATVAHQVP